LADIARNYFFIFFALIQNFQDSRNFENRNKSIVATELDMWPENDNPAHVQTPVTKSSGEYRSGESRDLDPVDLLDPVNPINPFDPIDPIDPKMFQLWAREMSERRREIC